MQEGIFIVSAALGRHNLSLCRCTSPCICCGITSIARMELWILTHLFLVIECRCVVCTKTNKENSLAVLFQLCIMKEMSLKGL